jgi:hypothetical protein
VGGVEKGDGQLNKRRGANGLERGKDMYEGPMLLLYVIAVMMYFYRNVWNVANVEVINSLSTVRFCRYHASPVETAVS